MPRKPKVDKPKKEVNKNQSLAKFIIQKWVDLTKIEWGKEMVLAYRLLKKYPEESFWRGLPANGRVASLLLFSGEKAKKTLQWKYRNFKERKDIDSKIILEDDKKVIELSDSKFGEDKTFNKKKRTIKDFCK